MLLGFESLPQEILELILELSPECGLLVNKKHTKAYFKNVHPHNEIILPYHIDSIKDIPDLIYGTYSVIVESTIDPAQFELVKHKFKMVEMIYCGKRDASILFNNPDYFPNVKSVSTHFIAEDLAGMNNMPNAKELSFAYGLFEYTGYDPFVYVTELYAQDHEQYQIDEFSRLFPNLEKLSYFVGINHEILSSNLSNIHVDDLSCGINVTFPTNGKKLQLIFQNGRITIPNAIQKFESVEFHFDVYGMDLNETKLFLDCLTYLRSSISNCSITIDNDFIIQNFKAADEIAYFPYLYHFSKGLHLYCKYYEYIEGLDERFLDLKFIRDEFLLDFPFLNANWTDCMEAPFEDPIGITGWNSGLYN